MYIKAVRDPKGVSSLLYPLFRLRDRVPCHLWLEQSILLSISESLRSLITSAKSALLPEAHSTSTARQSSDFEHGSTLPKLPKAPCASRTISPGYLSITIFVPTHAFIPPHIPISSTNANANHS